MAISLPGNALSARRNLRIPLKDSAFRSACYYTSDSMTVEPRWRNFAFWRDAEVSETAPHIRLLGYTRPTRHASETSRMTQGGPRNRPGEISKLLNVHAGLQKTGPRSYFAFFKASRNVQIVLASGTGSASPKPKKRINDNQSLISYPQRRVTCATCRASAI